MMCIDPYSEVVVVSDAFIACSKSHGEQYRILNGKKIYCSDEEVKRKNRPELRVLEDRYRLYTLKNDQRRERNKMYPYYCQRCSHRYKTESTFKNHRCKKENNTTATSRLIANYGTPLKIPTTLDGIVPEESPSEFELETDGVRDDDYYSDD
jgi:hypothetical protein